MLAVLLLIELSACNTSVFYFQDINLSKSQWTFTKFNMSIDIVDFCLSVCGVKQELSADSIACLEMGWYWSVRVLFRTSLIWFCTVCLGRSVPILRIIMVRGNVMTF